MDKINWLDALLLGIIILSALFGLFRGLIRGVFGIISLVLAFLLAKNYGHLPTPAFGALLGDSLITIVLSYALVFVLSLLVFSTLTFLLQKVISHADLGGMDKLGGMIFGLLRGGAIAAVILFLLSALPMQNNSSWQNSEGVVVFGHIMQKALTLSALAEYRRYWKFDSQNRPALVIPTQTLMASSRAIMDDKESPARDNLLAKLNDATVGATLHHNKTAQNVGVIKEQVRETPFLRQFQNFINDMFATGASNRGGQ